MRVFNKSQEPAVLVHSSRGVLIELASGVAVQC